MIDVIVGVLAILAGFFALVAGVGVLRLPDVLTRMHASTKSGTLACSLILVAVAIKEYDATTTIKVVAAIFFLLLTAPLAAHIIGRASERTGVPLRIFQRVRLERVPSGRPSAEPPTRSPGPDA